MRKTDQYIILPLSVLSDLAEVCAAAKVWFESKADNAPTEDFRNFANERAMSIDKMYENICAAPCVTVSTEAIDKHDYTEHPRKDVW